MSKPLVIVESPAKARTISSILGREFVVESSMGHVRDLPRSASEIPASHRETQWARLGVDVENGFRPLYIVTPEKRAHIKKLKDALRNASELYLATDEDREGESIAWHLLEVLNPRVPVRRMVFHEITRAAIQEAVRAPRELDRRLVDAQEARRILDRLVGYEVSPVLWRRVMPGLSAGRVQSVATRMIVERERARMRFTSSSYWDVDGQFQAEAGGFGATLVALDRARLATGKDFDENGRLKSEAVVLEERDARELVAQLDGRPFEVRSVEERPWRRSPYAPFMTSTLQQEAGRKLRFSVARTMQIAQRLYENGYITYMRTDSITLSEQAVAAAREQARQFGDEYVPAQPRTWKSKVKNAQEAHEAIRPAGERFRRPDEVEDELGADELKLYRLVWERTVASEMADARGRTVQLRIVARSADGREAEFRASGKVIEFDGFLRVYVAGADDATAQREDQEVLLPDVREGEAVRAVALEPKGHETQPPARFTEASLVKALEEMGVGRPSTYASIIDTIEDRGYVWKKGNALVPSWTAFAVVTLLEQYFTSLVDYDFTARMEDALDDIANGQQEAVPYLSRFYFGNGQLGLKTMVGERLGEIDPRDINSITIGKDDDGTEIVVRVGRYGPYLQRGEERASIPPDTAPDELTVEAALELLRAPQQERIVGTDPDSGLQIVARAGRFGPYVQLVDPAGDRSERGRTASLWKDMSLETLTLADALKVLQLPRVLGTAPDGEEVVGATGRYGPYLKKGKETRSVESEQALLGMALEEALHILAQPKQRRGAQRASAPPLRELGSDPVSGKPIVLREGRFGPYVTDGETNASLRKGDTVEGITTDRAAELLQERRERGPVQRKGRKPAPRAGKAAPSARKASPKGRQTKR